MLQGQIYNTHYCVAGREITFTAEIKKRFRILRKSYRLVEIEDTLFI